jgi:nucleoid-associated protein YgaU
MSRVFAAGGATRIRHGHSARGTARLLWTAATLMALAGCGPPSARFLRADCIREPSDDGGESIAFISTVRISNVTDDQILYWVKLVNARNEPIPSSDDSYRDAEGGVSAGRTFMVPQPNWEFERLRVAIPIEQLEIRPADVPVSVEFAVCRPDGTVLASEQVPLSRPRDERAASARGSSREPATPPGQRKPERDAPGSSGRDRKPGDKPAAAAPTRPSAVPKPTASQPAGRERSDARAATSAPATRRSGADSRPTSRPAGSAPATSRPAASQAASPARPTPSSPTPTRKPTAGSPVVQPVPASRPTTVPAPQPAAAASQPASPASGPTTQAEAARIYVVRSGDTLAGIARRLLGDPDRWAEIFDLNRSQLESADALWVGMELQIPQR